MSRYQVMETVKFTPGPIGVEQMWPGNSKTGRRLSLPSLHTRSDATTKGLPIVHTSIPHPLVLALCFPGPALSVLHSRARLTPLYSTYRCRNVAQLHYPRRRCGIVDLSSPVRPCRRSTFCPGPSGPRHLQSHTRQH